MGSAFGAIWEDPEGGFIKFVIKRASKQDQTLHMEGKFHVILYFRAVWTIVKLLSVLSSDACSAAPTPKPTPTPTTKPPLPPCNFHENYIGDKYCDDDANNVACKYDGGDCCGSNVKKNYCKQCKCLDPKGQWKSSCYQEYWNCEPILNGHFKIVYNAISVVWLAFDKITPLDLCAYYY